VGALVRQVGQVLARGHSLFGDPTSSGGGVSGLGSGPGLAGAAGRVRIAHHIVTGLSGAGPARYGGFASDATAALDHAAAADDGLGVQVRDAGSADRSGRASSSAVVGGAASDTAGLSPVSGTAAGQRALVSALRARVAQQQKVVEAYKARDARLSALVRSLRYSTGGRGMIKGGGGIRGETAVAGRARPRQPGDRVLGDAYPTRRTGEPWARTQPRHTTGRGRVAEQRMPPGQQLFHLVDQRTHRHPSIIEAPTRSLRSNFRAGPEARQSCRFS
jgi:hypothetical protein